MGAVTPRHASAPATNAVHPPHDYRHLLLIAGMVIMLVIFTGWGLYEILSMPQATLP